MKKIVGFFFLLIVSINVFSQDTVMVELRKLFYLATISESYIDKTEEYINSNPTNNAFGSYQSMLLFMQAKYAINPYSKLNYFKKGRTKMEETLTLYPNNIENRFLRLAIQTKLPGFLGYRSSVQEDKEFILKNYKNLKDRDLKARVQLFFKENDMLTNEELKRL